VNSFPRYFSRSEYLYHWLKARYSPMPSAADIQMAKSLLKPKAERMTKAELKKRGREVEKEKARAAARYPWLKAR
jgi:hypothetical protein